MNFDRFKKIIEYNRLHMNEITECIRDFYSKLGIGHDENILKIDQIARSEFEKRSFVMIELPLKDKEIGAMAYRGDFWGYIFINSSLPKVNINFALCHEFYHVLFQPDSFKNTIELFMDEHYHDDEDEKKANMFAGALLMPELSFGKMFSIFSKESDDDVETVCRLMNYYEVPYTATVIRCYEMELFDNDPDRIKRLLNTSSDEIKKVFDRKWLDAAILVKTGRDQFEKLMQVVHHFGITEIEGGRLKESSLKKVEDNLHKIYEELV